MTKFLSCLASVLSVSVVAMVTGGYYHDMDKNRYPYTATPWYEKSNPHRASTDHKLPCDEGVKTQPHSRSVDQRPGMRKEKFRNPCDDGLHPTKTVSPPKPKQEGLENILEFKRHLGADTKLIKDSKGNIIGVDIDPQQTDGTPVEVPKTPSRTDYRIGKGDQDICCSTHEAYYINTTLQDVTKTWRTISQYSHQGSYQFIRHGVCGSRKGLCRGQCVQSYVTKCVGTIDPSGKVNFKFFEIPGYCSCKSIPKANKL